MNRPRNFSLLGDQDLFLFNEGTHFRLWEKLGAHSVDLGDHVGTYFAVWAPNAESVSVVGDFNGWDREAHPLAARGSSGIWEGFLGGVKHGSSYKFHVRSSVNGYAIDKADPLGRYAEVPPRTASVVWNMDYVWKDDGWMHERRDRNASAAPISIYEVHFGSWCRGANGPLSYREAAPLLAEHVRRMGFTHVEFLPIMEHPFAGSWGYQTTGYFAPTSRFGTPQDFMYLIDTLHQAGIGVILDWVPSHFPSDGHGLAFFDGTHLYEHADPRQGFHPDWKSFIFNYGRHEVVSFLISSAMYWLETFHVDGLRVDAVASMLYLDYSRREGEWIPNRYGGRENLDAISFLRCLNEQIYGSFPGVQTFAEESTAWPMVSRPIYLGGLGFGFKWDMGWMHDVLAYMSEDPIHRRYHHDKLTFRGLYMFSENYCLPLSHDEVVHGKGSLLGKMPGDEWQRFANLRLLYATMHGQPGKKLLFMGSELGPWREWDHDASVEWGIEEYTPHAGVKRWLADLNHLYVREPALHAGDTDPGGFEWVDANDAEQSVLTFLRRGGDGAPILVALNFTPVPRHGYRVGVPEAGRWTELLNSDASVYGGSGVGNAGGVEAEAVPAHGLPFSVTLTLPPLAALFMRGADENPWPLERME